MPRLLQDTVYEKHCMEFKPSILKTLSFTHFRILYIYTLRGCHTQTQEYFKNSSAKWPRTSQILDTRWKKTCSSHKNPLGFGSYRGKKTCGLFPPHFQALTGLVLYMHLLYTESCTCEAVYKNQSSTFKVMVSTDLPICCRRLHSHVFWGISSTQHSVKPELLLKAHIQSQIIPDIYSQTFDGPSSSSFLDIAILKYPLNTRCLKEA